MKSCLFSVAESPWSLGTSTHSLLLPPTSFCYHICRMLCLCLFCIYLPICFISLFTFLYSKSTVMLLSSTSTPLGFYSWEFFTQNISYKQIIINIWIVKCLHCSIIFYLCKAGKTFYFFIWFPFWSFRMCLDNCIQAHLVRYLSKDILSILCSNFHTMCQPRSKLFLFSLFISLILYKLMQINIIFIIEIHFINYIPNK